MERSKGNDLANILGVEGGAGTWDRRRFFFLRFLRVVSLRFGINSSKVARVSWDSLAAYWLSLGSLIILWHIKLDVKEVRRLLKVLLSMDLRISFTDACSFLLKNTIWFHAALGIVKRGYYLVRFLDSLFHLD